MFCRLFFFHCCYLWTCERLCECMRTSALFCSSLVCLPTVWFVSVWFVDNGITIQPHICWANSEAGIANEISEPLKQSVLQFSVNYKPLNDKDISCRIPDSSNWKIGEKSCYFYSFVCAFRRSFQQFHECYIVSSTNRTVQEVRLFKTSAHLNTKYDWKRQIRKISQRKKDNRKEMKSIKPVKFELYWWFIWTVKRNRMNKWRLWNRSFQQQQQNQQQKDALYE